MRLHRSGVYRPMEPVRGKNTDQILRYRLLCYRLRRAREAAGLSQEAAARALGRPQSYIAKTERGERRVDLLEAQDFVALYHVDANEFFGPMTRGERARLTQMRRAQHELEERSARIDEVDRSRGGTPAVTRPRRR